MAETEKPKEDAKAAETKGPETVQKGADKPKSNFAKAVPMLIAVIAVLALAYLALVFLMGSDFNLDTLLTGSKSTSLPRLP
ncbi:MAG: hypothetical protein V1744_07530 [Candidatus Altiarchaeota archaeon]